MKRSPQPSEVEKPSYATNLFNIQSNNEYQINPNVMEVAGVFWDIENCAVPHQKSAFALVWLSTRISVLAQVFKISSDFGTDFRVDILSKYTESVRKCFTP